MAEASGEGWRKRACAAFRRGKEESRWKVGGTRRQPKRFYLLPTLIANAAQTPRDPDRAVGNNV